MWSLKIGRSYGSTRTTSSYNPHATHGVQGAVWVDIGRSSVIYQKMVWFRMTIRQDWHLHAFACICCILANTIQYSWDHRGWTSSYASNLAVHRRVLRYWVGDSGEHGMSPGMAVDSGPISQEERAAPWHGDAWWCMVYGLNSDQIRHRIHLQSAVYTGHGAPGSLYTFWWNPRICTSSHNDHTQYCSGDVLGSASHRVGTFRLIDIPTYCNTQFRRYLEEDSSFST